MGLTIHWDLGCPSKSSPEEVVEKLEELRAAAEKLPFAEVDKKVTFLKGDGANWSKREQDDPLRWALIQSSAHVGDGLKTSYMVEPTEVAFFSVYPGEESEEANFGLARYPKTIITQEGKTIPTKLTG